MRSQMDRHNRNCGSHIAGAGGGPNVGQRPSCLPGTTRQVMGAEVSPPSASRLVDWVLRHLVQVQGKEVQGKLGYQQEGSPPPRHCDYFTDCQRTKTLWSHPDISGVTRPRGHTQGQWLSGKNLLCDAVRMSVPCLHLDSVTVPSRATSD